MNIPKIIENLEALTDEMYETHGKDSEYIATLEETIQIIGYIENEMRKTKKKTIKLTRWVFE